MTPTLAAALEKARKIHSDCLSCAYEEGYPECVICARFACALLTAQKEALEWALDSADFLSASVVKCYKQRISEIEQALTKSTYA